MGGWPGDFGLSEIKPKNRLWLQDPKDRAKGTPLFMPPEVMMGQPFDERSDVYRFLPSFLRVLASKRGLFISIRAVTNVQLWHRLVGASHERGAV